MSDSHPHAFQAPSIHELAPLFPGYEIETLIATGGMGAVYRAIQKSLDRAVAIKILPMEFSKDAAFCEGFEAEAKAMAKLNHPNLIGVYDFGEVKGMLYIIMEYVPGKSLFHSANGIALDPGEVVRLVTGICEGLTHAHENGILHRDIKPSNILLDLEARPKIGDFGLARPMDRKIQEGEEIFGTPHYTAPEVVSAPHSVNNRADIFSVGVLLHELLTGKLPADDRRPASLISHCDPRFDSVIRKATNPQPEARYSSASEISKELHSIGQSLGPRVSRGPAQPVNPMHRPSVGRRPGRPVVVRKSSSGGSGFLVILLVAAIAAGAYLVLSQKPAPTTPSPTPVPAPTPEPTPPKSITPTPKPLPSPLDELPSEPASKPGVPPEIVEQKPTPPEPKPQPEPPVETTQPITPPPTPEPSVADLPKFDVPGFYVRARKAMQDKATPLIEANAKSLKKNVTDFDLAIKRRIRRMDSEKNQEKAETALKTFVTSVRSNNNRLPEKLGKDEFKDFKAVPEVLAEHVAKQEAIDATLTLGLEDITTRYYIPGLEKQIERLKAEKDLSAAKMIEDEVQKARSNSGYLPALMLGKDPDAKPANSGKKP